MGGWEGLGTRGAAGGASKVSLRGLESHPELLFSSCGYHEAFQARESMQRAVPLKATPTLYIGAIEDRHKRLLGTCHHCPGDRQGLPAPTRPQASAGSPSVIGDRSTQYRSVFWRHLYVS